MIKLLDNDQTKVEAIRLRNDGWTLLEISDRFGASTTTIGDFLKQRTYKKWWEKNDKPFAAGNIYDHHENIKQLNKKRYIITSAQNNTFAHTSFVNSLETIAKRINAQIIIGTFSYNKNGFQNLEKSDDEWFDPMIEPYILDEPAVLANGLIWCGELNILPTATNPLSGLHSYTRGDSGIVPHAKVQLESLPTHKEDPCRMMYTTGTVTKRNYIQKKSGQKASFHHVFGALLVEVDDDGSWFVRQLVADSETGCFYDLDTQYTPDGYYIEDDAVEAINWGDIHVEKIDDESADVCFYNRSSMLNVLKPNYQFIHDVLDFEARNHHNRNDPYFRFKKHIHGVDSVQDNINDVAMFLSSIDRDKTTTVVVESNHDLALKRWLKEADYKTDPENAVFFLEHQLAMYKSIQDEDFGFNIFEFSVKKANEYLNDVMFLKTDESFKICGQYGNGIECGQHGHVGNNGARGSIRSFQMLGARHNVGHSHTAAIKDGVYYAGVIGRLNMGYNQGGSSWSHSNIVTYKNGKRAIVTISNNKWRAMNG
jgi:hypothetical protein